MANIQNQIDEISTAFYGSQVRGAIVEGLESINDEVNELYTNLNDLMVKANTALTNANNLKNEVGEASEGFQQAQAEYINLKNQIEVILQKLEKEKTALMLNHTIMNNSFLNDFDKAVEPGYYSYAATEGTKNIPPNCGYGVLEVILGVTANDQTEYNPNDNNWIWQIVYDTSGIIAYRNAENQSGWQQWNTLATTSNETFENCTLNTPTISNASLDGSVTLIGGTGIQGGAITNTTLSGTITNIAQINGGTYDNPRFIGASIENQGTFNGGTYSNPTIEAFGNNIIQYNKLPYSVIISPGITATGAVEFFLINAPQLGGENITGSIGIVTVTTTLDEWYTWPKDNNIVVDITGIPNATARTISPFNNLNIGIDGGQLYMSGVGTALNNGQTYTNQALLWQ
ncbi:hypothetical protein [uncultured Clostridium sp.]|uniref:hypothetical protein n=1 Tax=uncultured Clostridium sp. TaxID=59620 RepID=UPI0026215617|nr:hypothetical protein [uncultured Clostridium sp.]